MKNLTYFTTIIITSVLLLSLKIPFAGSADTTSETQGWQQLQNEGHVAILRHAIAPGTGDPPQFILGKCDTQRNLSSAGRRQATKIGKIFQDHGISRAKVYSSQWCRCLETAELLDLGEVKELPYLNSFFRDFERGEEQTDKLKQWLAAADLTEPLVLVTHQVNITALTGIYPQSGEMVVVKRVANGELVVIARMVMNREQ